MQMGPGAAAGTARFPEHLTLDHRVAGAHELLREMSVPRLAPAFMINHDGVAVAVLNACERDDTARRRFHVMPVRDGNIDSAVKRRLAGERVLPPTKFAAYRRGGCHLTHAD